MKHIDLLGESLKSDFLIDLFETYDTQVSYEYDRTHENLADEYNAAISELGLAFVFDKDQILKTMFVTIVDIKTYCPLEDLFQSCQIFQSKSQAQQFVKKSGATAKEGSAEFAGGLSDWIRIEYPAYLVHYEFRKSRLHLITLSRKSGRHA